MVNVNGGAIAVGHPIGMSGARITLHVALELARRGSGYGVAALCGAGGQGDALILRAGNRGFANLLTRRAASVCEIRHIREHAPRGGFGPLRPIVR